MNLQLIIDEADTRIPNAFATDQKVDWLNEINNEFFDIVKIPKTFSFTTTASPTVTVGTDLREKNIKKVVVGSNYYRSMAYEDITAAFNYYTVDDTTGIVTLVPQPATGSKFVCVYDKIGTTQFVVGTLTAVPDAPAEYHWLYILGLCSRIAKAMNDAGLANNYENDYKNNLAVAQQNYTR